MTDGAQGGQTGAETPGSRLPEPLRFPRSPTLGLADEVEAARRAGRDALSLSTPRMPAIDPAALLPPGASTRLTPPEGDPALRDLIARTLFGRWRLPGHRVVVTSGAKAALFCLFRGLLPPGSRIAVVAPAWPSYVDLARLAGHEPDLIETRAVDGFALDGATLGARLDGAAALVLSNPANPSGRIYRPAELSAAADAARRAGCYLVLDESFSELVWDRSAWAVSLAPGSPHVAVVNSLSKNRRLQGLRLGAALVPDHAVEAVVGVHQTILSAAPSLSQDVARALLADAAAPAPADLYAASRAVAERIIARAGWNAAPNQGTFYFFPRADGMAATLQRLREAGLHALSGAAFGPAYADHVRLCFGRPESEMAEIERRMEDAGAFGRS